MKFINIVMLSWFCDIAFHMVRLWKRGCDFAVNININVRVFRVIIQEKIDLCIQDKRDN